jgi:hypothetical protein
MLPYQGGASRSSWPSPRIAAESLVEDAGSIIQTFFVRVVSAGEFALFITEPAVVSKVRGLAGSVMNNASSPADTALTKKVWMIGLVWIVVIVDWIGLNIPHMIVDRIGY